MKRLFLFLSFLILNIVAALAQHITANAPQQVATGQQFRLQYSIDTQDISDFSMGQVPDAFEVLMGPSRSTSSSFQIINGKTSQSSSTTLTYILVANKNGTFTLPSASVTADGKKISSNTVKIVVSGQAQSQNNGGGSGSGNSRHHRDAQEQDMGKNISGNELFIRVSANKKRVYEQEPILLTYKVYSLVNLTQLEGKMPDLKGFHTQEVPLPQQKSFSLEQFNGRNYNTVTWSQYVMFPQITGKLHIPSLTFNGIVAMRNRYVDPFEAFFNGGSGYVEVKKSIKAPGIDIEVEPLPERPANFSGGVGKFSIPATVDKTEVKANDPINMKVVVSGVGNLKLIKEPVVEFPKDFDRYDAKLTDKTKLTTNGLEGSMVYEFLTVPRHQGEFDIPPVEFVFFNTATRKYETVKTEAFHIHVEKGDGSEVNTMRDYSSQEEVQTLAKDIRYIKLGDVKQKKVGSFFFGSGIYWAVMGVLLAIFVALFVIFRQRAIANADVVGSRAGKANKVATKRLKKAAKLMNDNKSNEFFDEVLRAMWGYVGDKLNIPVAKLNRDNIRERFDERGAEPEAVNAFVEILDMCEYQRYAPGDPRGNMSKVYKEAVSVIEKLESMMKKNKKKSSDNVFKSVMFILACSLLSLMPSSADAEGVETGVTKAMADSAYASGNYQKAVVLYDSLLKSGVSFELYYNLGNAYYRTEDNTRAILNYERALMLSPSDADVRFNLQMARSKTIDKILPESEMFFVTWYRSLINMASVDGWAYFALTMLGLALLLVLLYLFADMLLLRKIGFFGAIVALLLFVFGNIFAWQQKHMMDTQRGAIIMESAVSVKSTPAANGTDLFILHEGTKVTIVDDSMREWKEVRVSDGKQGWIKTQQIEMI